MTAATWEIIRHPAPVSFWAVWFLLLLNLLAAVLVFRSSLRGALIVAARAVDYAIWAVARG